MLRSSIDATFGEANPKALRTHAGLWVDKMLAAKEPSSAVAGPHLRKLIGLPVPDGYDLAFSARRMAFDLAADLNEAVLVEAKTTSRLVVGLGAKGVLEIGLTLDHTWGVPYLPGSALKGIAASAAAHLAEGESWTRPTGWPEEAPVKGLSLDQLSDYQLLFGTTANAGLVRFHDAWWDPTGAAAVPISMDVMTVHHPKYYQSAESEALPPTDFDEPVPVPFLSASGKFVFALEGPPAWCKVAYDLLEQGLAQLGAGAKTSSGYGRMTTRVLETERVQARRTSEESLGVQLASYKPNQRDGAANALVRAVQAGVDSSKLSSLLALLQLAQRKVLVEAVRVRLSAEEAARLDSCVEAPKAPPPVSSNAPKEKAKVPAGAAAEPRKVRARFVPDGGDAKRYFIEIDGEARKRKGHTINVEAGLLERLRGTKDWVDVVLGVENGKASIR